jgi:hypothetical protein
MLGREGEIGLSDFGEVFVEFGGEAKRQGEIENNKSMGQTRE